jgi:hypothetical protein
MNNKIFIRSVDYGVNHMLQNELPAPVDKGDATQIYPNYTLSALEANYNLYSLVSKLLMLEQDQPKNHRNYKINRKEAV